MSTEPNAPMTIETVDRQRKYVREQKKKGDGLGVVFADAFLRGMRDLGYKSPAWALAELIDNSFQAAANNICLRFAVSGDGPRKAKPDMLAICDDGNGMIPEMIGYAVRWGGTDREGDRHGLGRYGYGLPSAAVSLAKRYTVYSRVEGHGWHAVTIDIDQLAAVSGNIQETQALLTAKAADPPEWVFYSRGDDDQLDLSKMASGTIVILEDPDRLRRLDGWILADTLRAKLLSHFGVIYRHWIPERRIVVDGVLTQAVDPLFLLEHARFFDETAVRAEAVEGRTIEVTTAQGKTGRVTIRASLLPPHFQLDEPLKYGVKGAKVNRNRWGIMRQFNGLLVCRGLRQIDCIAPNWTRFQTYDANVKVEINFDAELDEYFGITTAKQQIVIEDEMWQKLQHGGVGGGGLIDLVKDLRGRRDELMKTLKASANNRDLEEKSSPSAVAMEESAKFKAATPEPTETQLAEAQRNLDQAAERDAAATKRPKEEVKAELEAQTARRRWEIVFDSIPEGPFYRPVRLGMQKRLVINTDHPFYTKVYDAEIYESAPEIRAALEVMLFVLAERELEARGEAENFYRAERNHWSQRLRHALDHLLPDDDMTDKAAAVAEQMHMTMELEAPSA